MSTADITVEITQLPIEGGWQLRASAHDVGYNHFINDENPKAIQEAMTWLSNTVAFLMGCVAADRMKDYVEAGHE